MTQRSLLTRTLLKNRHRAAHNAPSTSSGGGRGQDDGVLLRDGGVAYRGAAGIGAPLVPAAGRDEPTGEVRKAHTQGTDVLLWDVCKTKEEPQDRNYELTGDEGFEFFFGDWGVLVVGFFCAFDVFFGPELA